MRTTKQIENEIKAIQDYNSEIKEIEKNNVIEAKSKPIGSINYPIIKNKWLDTY